MYIELKGKFFKVYKNKDGSMFMMKKVIGIETQ